jgi:hypothetical protein
MVTTKLSSFLSFQNPKNKLPFEMKNNNSPIRNLVLNELLQWTTRGSTRRYVALEGNSKIYEKAHGK